MLLFFMGALCYLYAMASNVSGIEYSFLLKQHRRRNEIFLFGFILIIFIICSFWQKFLLFPVSVSSESMKPLIDSGDIVMVTPLASVKPVEGGIPVLSSIAHCIDLKRGDVVLVSPAIEKDASLLKKAANSIVKFVTFQRRSIIEKSNLVTESDSVRRLVGFPGDTLYMKDCVLYIKPQNTSHALTEFELSDSQYDIFIEGTDASWSREIGFPGEMDTVVLKDDEYFVLADDRSHGIDSRYYGPVNGKNIKGRLVFRYWPVKNFSLF